jgi:hypothetical protein
MAMRQEKVDPAPRYLRAVALALASLAVASILASSVILLVVGPPAAHLTGDVGLDLVTVVSYLGWVAAGLVLSLRLPRFGIGWILLVPAWSTAFQSLAGRAIIYTHVYQERPTLMTEMVAVIGDALWVPGVAVGFIALMVLFPDGRPLGPRWKWVLWVAGGVAATYVFVTLFVHAPLYFMSSVDNPWGLVGNSEWFEVGQTAPLVVLIFVGVPAGILALAMRWRRGGVLEREQIKWLLWAALIQVMGLAVSIIGSELIEGPVQGGWTGAVGEVAGLAIPMSIVLAVTRSRLYEIDRIVSRTVSYGVIVLLLAGIYVGVVGFVSIFPFEGPLPVAATTLVMAATFNPLRRRVREIVDRRFNRSRYDAARTIEAFSERLRSRITLDELGRELQDVTARTMEPATLSIWVRESP